MLTGCKKELIAEFEMKDLGLIHYFLGLEVWQIPDEISLNQGQYRVEIPKRFMMMDCKSMAIPMNSNLKLLSDTFSDQVDPTIYRELIRSLMYLFNTKPDIFFAVNALSQYMVETKHVHWITTKHVLRYLKDMDLDMSWMVSWNYMDIQILIGSEVQWIGKAHQDVALVWIQYDFLVL